MTDKELMLEYQKGDHLAFTELYIRHKGKVYAYLEKRLPKSDQVDDVFQKIFTKFHKSRHLFDPKYEVLPWIYTISSSELLDFQKKRCMNSVVFDENTYGPELQSENYLFEIQSEKLLTQKEKLALTERYMEDKEFDEISLILQTSESNVRKIISRAIQKLKKKYKGAKL